MQIYFPLLSVVLFYGALLVSFPNILVHFNFSVTFKIHDKFSGFRLTFKLDIICFNFYDL